MFAIENVFEKRAEFENACERANACMEEFPKLLKAETKAEFLGVIYKNFYWVYGHVDKFGLEYDSVDDFNEGIAGVRIGDKWGFVNTKFKEICEIKFDYLNFFKEGFARVQIGDKWGFVNSKCKEICEIKFDYVGYFDDGFARVQIGNKWGILDSDGKEVYEVKYTLAEVMELLKELRKCLL